MLAQFVLMINLSFMLLGFGGLYGTRSKYGDMDITGDGAIEFFTNRIKITSKWPTPTVPEYVMGLEQQQQQPNEPGMGGGATSTVDHANFAGRM
jgi:hypothetical protein